VAAAVWVVRSWAEPDFVKPANGPARNSAVRGGVCFVSRDAACEASDSEIGMQLDFALAGISRGGEIVSGV